jgi:hypothetical protein
VNWTILPTRMLGIATLVLTLSTAFAQSDCKNLIDGGGLLQILSSYASQHLPFLMSLGSLSAECHYVTGGRAGVQTSDPVDLAYDLPQMCAGAFAPQTS